MNITLFGGTGTTGLILLQKALAAGHHITVYARNPSKITYRHAKLRLVTGELTEVNKLEETVQGADAVISLLGPTNLAKELPISTGMKHIIEAMQKNGVKRLVAAVSSSYRDPNDKFQFWFDFGVIVLKVIAKDSILKDIVETGKRITNSQLDWTMVRLPKLSNQLPKGNYNIGYTGDGKVKNFFLSRTDLANFLIRQINDQTYLREAPVVSN